VVEIGLPAGAASESRIGTLGEPGQEPFGRFRRRLERFKSLADEQDFSGSLDDESELRLQVMLLREENARLKAARHQPADVGSVIDRARLLAAPGEDGERLDDAWTLLGECLVIHEGLDQVCVEIQAAMDGIRDRLAALEERIRRASSSDESGLDAASQISA
jgi:hypothetical protein